MKQVELLKRILVTPNIYKNETDRGNAKRNLMRKIVRRDRRMAKKSQLSLELNFGVEYPDWFND